MYSFASDNLSNNKKINNLFAKADTSDDVHFEQERQKMSSSSNFANPAQNVSHIGIREGMRVADFGSGSGHYTLAMAAVVGDSGEVYSVDVQKDLLSRIDNDAKNAGFKNVHTIWANIEKLGGTKIADDLLDLVLVSNTLFQVENREELYKEIKRTLTPGGRFAVIDWSESWGGMGPHKDAVITEDQAKNEISRSDFDFVQNFDAGSHHYGLLFKLSTVDSEQTEIKKTEEELNQERINSIISQEL